jgi:cobalt-zinc-cadmium efflux system outer membrane protein
LPLWNHFNGEILAAKAAQEQTQAQLDKIRIQAAADLAEARLSYVEASQRARRYQSSLVPRSAEVTKNMSYAFQKGGATLTDLLEAERNDNVIRLAAVQSQADVAITAVSLQAALGHLDGSDVN